MYNNILTRYNSGGGGAIYLSCSDLEQLCMSMIDQSLGLPNDFTSVLLRNNSAKGYGGEIATDPFETVTVSKPPHSITPGIDIVNVNIALRDGFGQLIKNSGVLSSPYLLEFWVCPSTSCGVEESLTPLKFLSFDSVSGISSAIQADQTIQCAINTSNVTLQFSLYGSESGPEAEALTSRINVRCLSCRGLQVRVASLKVTGMSIWACAPCLVGQYIIDPDIDSCQDCPLGESPTRHKDKPDKPDIITMASFYLLDLYQFMTLYLG